MKIKIIPKIGSKFGSCVELCQHLDCLEYRKRMEQRCLKCDEEILYEHYYELKEGLIHTYCSD